MRRMVRNQRGFLLVDLMVAVVVIGIAVGAVGGIFALFRQAGESHGTAEGMAVAQQLGNLNAILVPGGFGKRGTEGKIRAIATEVEVDPSVRTFLIAVSNACVMECYFRDHMVERDLLFLDDIASHLAAFNSSAPEPQQLDFITQLHRTLNAPASNIRNRLLRIPADSPELLAVIQREGAV